MKYSAEPLGWPSLYALLHTYVPGYNALRVPARFASLFFVFLAVLAAFGIMGFTDIHQMNGLKNAGVTLDRKSLSEIAMTDPAAFDDPGRLAEHVRALAGDAPVLRAKNREK